MLLAISTFTSSRDNQATIQELEFPHFIEEIDKPRILEESASIDEAERLKPTLPAWSPATYTDNLRKDAHVTSASCLVFDIDGKEKEGIEIAPFLARVESYGRAYLLHTTLRSGFCQEGYAKFRLVFPLAAPVDVGRYVELWDTIVEELGLEADRTRRHPGGIFFAPAVFREHLDKYICRSNVELPYLGALFGGRDLNADPLLESVRNATDKHVSINAAAFALGIRGTSEEETVTKLIEALHENERRKSSAPVVDWYAAEKTIRKGWESGNKEREKEEKVAERHARKQKKKEKTEEQKKKEEERTQRLAVAPWESQYDRDRKGNVKPNRHNAWVLLSNHPTFHNLHFNVRTRNIQIPGVWRKE